MTETILYLIAVVGIAIGIMWRTYGPYLKKVKEGVIQSFDRKFIWTAVISFFVALMTGIQIISGFNIDATSDWLLLFILAILYGATWNEAVNRGLWK